MNQPRALRGSCSCGRNRYTVSMPPDSRNMAQVLFSSSSEHRTSFSATQSLLYLLPQPSPHKPHPADLLVRNPGHHLSTPLPSLLRIPLSWYQSSTHALFPDESHASIRRVYSSPGAPHAHRQFCGYCGSPLTFWTEWPPTEAEFISLTLGSILGEDLREVEEWAALPFTVGGGGGAGNVAGNVAEEEDEEEGRDGKRKAGADEEGWMTTSRVVDGVLPWFEALVEGSRLGRGMRLKRMTTTTQQADGQDAPVRRVTAGGASSVDGTLRVEWEIVEWDEVRDGSGNGNGNGNGNGKRKIGEVDQSTSAQTTQEGVGVGTGTGTRADVEMQG